MSLSTLQYDVITPRKMQLLKLSLYLLIIKKQYGFFDCLNSVLRQQIISEKTNEGLQSTDCNYLSISVEKYRK